jgi:hypothetical protein
MNEEEESLGLFLPETLEQHQTALQAALDVDNSVIWEEIGFGVTENNFENILQKLIEDIKNGNIVNYNQQEYISVASMVISAKNIYNLNPHLKSLIEIVYEDLGKKLKKIDKEVNKLTDELIEKMDPKRVTIFDGKKTLLFVPQLERQCNWAYSLLENDFVKDIGSYRDILRSKYYMICQYIEDLLIKKSKIQVENIKLELCIRGHHHLPIYICILCNLVKINEIKLEIERLVKLMDSTILMNKQRKFQIWEDWWTGTNERKICPIYTEFIDKKCLQFGVRWL